MGFPSVAMRADCGEDESSDSTARSLPSELRGFIKAHADCSLLLNHREMWRSRMAMDLLPLMQLRRGASKKGLPATIPEGWAPAAIPGGTSDVRLREISRGAPPEAITGWHTQAPDKVVNDKRGELTIRIGDGY